LERSSDDDAARLAASIEAIAAPMLPDLAAAAAALSGLPTADETAAVAGAAARRARATAVPKRR